MLTGGCNLFYFEIKIYNTFEFAFKFVACCEFALIKNSCNDKQKRPKIHLFSLKSCATCAASLSLSLSKCV